MTNDQIRKMLLKIAAKQRVRLNKIEIIGLNDDDRALSIILNGEVQFFLLKNIEFNEMIMAFERHVGELVSRPNRR